MKYPEDQNEEGDDNEGNKDLLPASNYSSPKKAGSKAASVRGSPVPDKRLKIMS
jgi:hypothetical protein